MIVEDFAVVEVESIDMALEIEGKSFGEHLPKCRERAMKLLETIPPNGGATTDKILKDLKECLKNGLGPAIRRRKDEIRFERKVSFQVAVCGIVNLYGNEYRDSYLLWGIY